MVEDSSGETSARTPLIAGVAFGSLSPSLAAVWEGKVGRRLHRVHGFYNLDVPDYFWTTEVPAMLNAGYKLMLTFEPRLN
ncbi:hypothetical protein D6833_07035, partial [Candidatus Parcubacteria bacterium]